MRARMDRISSARARKKLARSPLLALALALCACGGAITEVPPGQAFRLRIGESARVEGTSLVVTFRAVLEDTRCPIDVVCILAGNGRVQLGVGGVRRAGRLVLNTTSEPLLPEIRAAVAATWGVPVFNGFGATEGAEGGIVRLGSPVDPTGSSPHAPRARGATAVSRKRARVNPSRPRSGT